MSQAQHIVSTVSDLLAALGDAATQLVIVSGGLHDVPSLQLSPGQSIVGRDDAALRFAPGQDGVRLSRDNRVEGLRLAVDPDRCAVFNDTQVEHLGRLELQSLVITGNVRLLAQDQVRAMSRLTTSTWSPPMRGAMMFGPAGTACRWSPARSRCGISRSTRR
jgi:hypothetical protein